MQEKKIKVVFAGGGTGGHIYPGLAVAEELKRLSSGKIELEIHWIGNKAGMDKSLVEENLEEKGGSIKAFHAIPCGKLRRYFSFNNFIDLFKIALGFISSFFLLKKIKPSLVFSKGGFVSVPPLASASLLKIPSFTHECDFTPGLSTRINSRWAKKILLSYEETKSYFSSKIKEKCFVTGNPVRSSFYNSESKEGFSFLSLEESEKKPILLVLGGSLGAKQVNDLILESIQELKKDWIVVHQTGKAFEKSNPEIMKSKDENYYPFAFISCELPSLLKASSVVVSRAGANTIWECAVSEKPIILVPLLGSGTRGDQKDNARYFSDRGAAIVLEGKDATKENLLLSLERLKSKEEREKLSCNCKKIVGETSPSETIAHLIFEEIVK